MLLIDVIDATIPMVLWSSTELLLTIICASVIVLRPLYVKFVRGSKNETSTPSQSLQLSTYMARKHNQRSSKMAPQNSVIYMENGNSQFRSADAKYSEPQNTSEESILREMNAQSKGNGDHGIKRVDEVILSYDQKPSSEKSS